MSSSSYLELLKLKQAKLLKVVQLFESGVGKRSDFVDKIWCDSHNNVSFNHSKNAVLKLSFIRDVKLECPNKRLDELRVLFGNKKPFRCRYCVFATKRKDNLLEHQLRMHSKSTGCEKVFACEFDGCDFRTTRNHSAVEHRRRHLKIKPFKCHHPDCGRSFVSRKHLQQHKVVHDAKKRFKCEQNNCKFATKHRSYLRLHQAVHSSFRAFRCPHENCTYAAKLRQTLQYHLLTHSETKPFKCHFNGCNYASYRKQCLKRHRLLHSGVRPFQCDYEGCSYASRQKANLVRHKRSHERERKREK